MKRLMLVLGLMIPLVYTWSETNVVEPIQERIRLEEQIRMRLRDRLRTEECDQICDRLFKRIREGASSERQYEKTLAFVKTYMHRNGNSWNPDDLFEVGKFYQQNSFRYEGTTREKRNALMLEAEKRIRNRMQKNDEVRNAQEKERRIYSYSYQNKMRQGNISENADKARMMRQNRGAHSDSGKK